jgi:hypothetical protein
MGYCLFVDDLRFPPDDGRDWVVARDSAAALAAIDGRGWPVHVAFDHDLGGDDTTMALVHRILDMLMDEGSHLPFTWSVHSDNPPGAANVAGLLESFERAHPRPAAPSPRRGP